MLAHASSYTQDFMERVRGDVNPLEFSIILVAFAYVAHCYVLDETCPLSYWHRFLCREICPLKSFDAAVLRLMAMRHYILRVNNTDLQHRYNQFFQAAATDHEVQANDSG